MLKMQIIKSLSRVPTLNTEVSCEQQTYFEPFPGQESQHNWDSLPIILNAERYFGGDVYALPHVVGGVNGVKVAVHREGQLIENDDHQIPPGTDE